MCQPTDSCATWKELLCLWLKITVLALEVGSEAISKSHPSPKENTPLFLLCLESK